MAERSQAKARSLKQEQLLLTTALRDEGRSWHQIAQVVSEKYGVNARVALRIARGWTQPRAADEWNKLWPTDPKTFKNFSYWEQWPGGSGHTPSLETLTKLARLYQCHLADLLSDCEDFRNLDPIHQTARYANALPGLLRGKGGGRDTKSEDPHERDLSDIIAHVQEIEITDLAKIAATWSKGSGSEETRRSALLKLSAGLSLAATSPFLAAVPAEALVISDVDTDLSGIWLSSYSYFSTSREKIFEGAHYVVLRQDANSLTAESIKNTEGSLLRLAMTLKNNIVTGTWSEATSAEGHYQGVTYHGTLQMVANPMGRSMTGKWVGFSKDFQVESGDWNLRWVEGSTSKQSQERYRLRL